MPDRGDRRTARGGDHGHDHAHHRVALPVLSLRGARRHRIAGQLLLPSLRLAASAARPVVCRPCSLDVLLPGGSGRRQTPACRGERHDPWSRSLRTSTSTCTTRMASWPRPPTPPCSSSTLRTMHCGAEIARCEGIEVDPAGDGFFFVRFDSPARALECARAAREAVKRLGIDIRGGIHTGECEVQGRTLTGMAVHVAARIQGLAGPGDILVSSTVKDIVVGSDARSEDRAAFAEGYAWRAATLLARRLGG